jgi:SAM-dependent methyltransferase
VISSWVRRFAPFVAEGGTVLDVACGAGRHTRWLLERGYRVVAVDIDVAEVADLHGDPRVEVVEADLEDGRPFPLRARRFDGVVVIHYLYRAILQDLVRAVAPGGILVYETFARGNERFGRPTNPAFLLRPGELLDAVRGELRVLAYEDLLVDEPAPAAIQRICARRER